nr:polyprotein [Isses picorna-like virus]
MATTKGFKSCDMSSQLSSFRNSLCKVTIEDKPEAYLSDNLQLQLTHRGRPMVVNLPDTEQMIYHLPLTGTEMNTLFDLYYSPFFENFFEATAHQIGIEKFVKLINDYLMTSQYRKGSMEYFKDQVFGTRRRRDAFKDYIDQYLLRPEIFRMDEYDADTESAVAESLSEDVTTDMQRRRYTNKDIRRALRDTKIFMVTCAREAMSHWPEKMQLKFEKYFAWKMNKKHMELTRLYGFDYWAYHEAEACFTFILSWNDKLRTPKTETAKAESAGEQAVVQQEQNTTFTDERESVTEQGYITTQQNSSMTGYSMPEEEWHVRNMMAKPIPFYNGEWSTASATGTVLKTWAIPGDVVLGPHYNMLSTFTFFRGHPKIRIQLNGTKFHSGRMIFAFMPYVDYANNEQVLWDMNNWTSFPHVILDAGISNSGILELPFVHMNTYFNTVKKRDWQSLGILRCGVFNKLSSSDTASQNLGITAWISFDECELHLPCAAHSVMLPKYTPPKTAMAESLIEGVVKSALPLVKDLIAPEMTSIGNVLGGAADQDKPTDPVETTRWVPNAVTGLSKGDGIDRCDRLCLKAGGYTIPDADIISTTNDDMNILELAKIPTRIMTANWTTTNTTGTRILDLPTQPTCYAKQTADSTVVPPIDILTPTLLGYVSRGFKYWRGGLRYKVQVIASQMHTGRLLVCYSPGHDLISTDFTKATYLNTLVIDLQEKHEVEFIVPYIAERPWLVSDYGDCLNGPEGAKRGDPDNLAQTGWLGIFVLNPLATPGSVATSIEINVLVSAADDFELAFPTDFAYYQGDGTVLPKTKAFAESLTTQETVTTRTEESVMTLGKGIGRLMTAGPHTMGEDAMNLKTLLRRYTKAFHNKFSCTGKCGQITFANTPCLSSVNKCFNNQDGRQYRTTLSHYSELFAFWRGSLRYKLVYKVSSLSEATPGLTLRVFHVPGTFNIGSPTYQALGQDPALWTGAFEAVGTMVAVTDLQGSLEFEIPFYTPYSQLKTQITGAEYSAFTSTGTIVVIIDAPKENTNFFMQYDLYQSAGDDFSLNYLRGAVTTQWVADTETRRSYLNDSGWPFPNKTVCMLKTNATEKDPEAAVAEAWQDYVPGVGHVTRVISKVNAAADNTTSVCDTANHLMMQAAKKLGLEALTEEDDEAGATTLYEDATSALTKLSSPVMTVTEVLLNSLKTLPEKLTRFLRPDITSMDMFVEISNMISGLTAFVASQTFVQKVCAIVTIVSTIVNDITATIRNQLYRYASTVLDYLCNLNGGKKGNEPPTSESFSLDLVAPLAASMVIGLGIIGFKKIPSDKETMEMCKGMSEKLRLFNFASTATTNVLKIWTEVKELTQWCMDWLLGKLQPQLLAQLKLDREFDQIEAWTQFIDKLETLPYADMIHYDLDFKNRVLRAVDQGEKYNSLILQGKCGRAASIIRQYCLKAAEIGHRCESSKNELPSRVDPFCICLTGGSNMGKSGCITSLGYDIMDNLEFPQHNRWCAVNCSEAYFTENYRQQAAVYFDDFSTFTSEEQYNSFMNLKANTALPLNMAFKKGEYFNSSFIFMTTNTAYPRPNFVTHHEALLRRRDMLIEVEWADIPEIREALARRENMAPYRKLDNSHLRFRMLDSVDPRAAPGPWMNYAQIRDVASFQAAAHLDIQKRKVAHDLQMAGYIMPAVEAGEVRKLCKEAMKNSPSLRLFDPDIFDHLEWDSANEQFELFLDATHANREELEQNWKEMQEFANLTKVDLQHVLKMHSYVVGTPTKSIFSITGKIGEFKTWIGQQIETMAKDHPWIATIAKWGLYVAGALAAASIAFQFTKKVIHKCACSALRYFGFRCGLCGKWPAFANVTAKLQAWMLKEWGKLYGNEDYKDHHVTTLAEEQALRIATKQEQTTMNLELGTRTNAVAEGVYSDVTRGHGPVRVVAQSSPYSTDTTGQRPQKVTAESGTARAADKLMQDRIFPYLYRFKTNGGKGISAQQINGFAIGDRKVLLNSHFFYGLQEGDIFECFHNGAWLPLEFCEDDCIRVPNKDLVIFEMPKSFHQHRNNVIHFISEMDLPKVQAVDGTLCKLTAQMTNVAVEGLKVKPLARVEFEQATAGGMETYRVQDAWRYAKCTSFGDCGSPLICISGIGSGKILGIHTASTSAESYSQLVTKEMLEGLLKSHLGTPLPKVEARLTNRIPSGHLGRIGCAEPKDMMIQSDKTQIIPTEIHGMVAPPATFPTALSKRDPRLLKRVDPMVGGIAKYANASVPFPRRHRQIVNDMMNEEVKNLHLVRPNPRPTTWEQACFGDESIDGFERLPKNTSPGYPWIKTRPLGEQGKAYLFDVDNRTMTKELEQAVLERENMAIRNERVLSIWVDCLKDERRSMEKIQTGQTRLFTVPPVDFSLLMRKYTMDFNAAIWNSRMDNDCKVGIDPQSLEWTTLYRWLAEFSPLCVAGDFTGFDGSMPADIIDDVRGDIDTFYQFHGQCSAQDMNVRKVLFEEVIHTVHLARDEFYMTHIGNKSGNPITVILNSRVNKRYMALAWLGIAEEKGLTDMATMAKFCSNVRCAIYGDDNILAIKPEVIEWFNQETISEYLARFKIIYTNEQKTGITKFKKLDECTFLKQSFANHELIKMIKVPHMAKKTIMELTNWTRHAPDQDELLNDNCNDALRFMYFYGKEQFTELRNKIQRSLLEKEKRFYLFTYMDLHLWFLNVIGATNDFKTTGHDNGNENGLTDMN